MRHLFTAFALPVLALTMVATPPAYAAAQPAPVTPEAAVDPARLALASGIANTVFPDGSYKRIMGETMSQLMDGMMGSMMKLPLREIVATTGVDSEKLAAFDDSSIEEIAAIIDPHFRERTRLMMDTMFAGMSDFMTQYEPPLRAALARSFARKFDQAELSAIGTFFATPAGSRFAADYMTMFLEPEIMGEMQGMMPEMMRQMPSMLAPAMKAAESLPKPRKISDLSPAEQKTLAGLLGISPAELRKAAARAEKEEKQ